MLAGFTDSYWADDPDDRKYTAGYVFSMGFGPVTWACKKQQALAISLAEVEYRDAVNSSQEALWLRQDPFRVWIQVAAAYSTLV